MNRRRPKSTTGPTASEPTPSEHNPKGKPASNARASAPLGWSPRDLLVPYILLAVSLHRAHGYLIEEYLKTIGFFSIELSTLYRTLRQLEKDGLLVSEWEPGATGPARRVYSLTTVGQTWLESWTSTLQLYRGMIDQFFDLYPPQHSAQADPHPDAGEPDTTES